MISRVGARINQVTIDHTAVFFQHLEFYLVKDITHQTLAKMLEII